MKLAKALCAVLFFIFLSGSAAEKANEKNLPDNLDGQTFLFTVDQAPSPDNPNAGFSYLMTFGKETYTYQIIGTGKIIQGRYSYSLRAEPLNTYLGVITATELYDDKKSVYQMVLLPKDQATGLYLYKQSYGAIQPDARLNSARYTRILF